MSVLGLVKDIVLFPLDMALDATMITPMIRSMDDDEADTPFGTVDRLRSMVKNLEDDR